MANRKTNSKDLSARLASPLNLNRRNLCEAGFETEFYHRLQRIFRKFLSKTSENCVLFTVSLESHFAKPESLMFGPVFRDAPIFAKNCNNSPKEEEPDFWKTSLNLRLDVSRVCKAIQMTGRNISRTVLKTSGKPVRFSGWAEVKFMERF